MGEVNGHKISGAPCDVDSRLSCCHCASSEPAKVSDKLDNDVWKKAKSRWNTQVNIGRFIKSTAKILELPTPQGQFGRVV